VERLEELVPELCSVQWDVFYFGLHLVEDGGPVTPNLGRVKTGFHAHAYAVQRRAIPRLIEVIDRRRPCTNPANWPPLRNFTRKR
jgi:hypothetical protein